MSRRMPFGIIMAPIPTAGLPHPLRAPFPDDFSPGIAAALAMTAERAKRLVELLPGEVLELLAQGPISQVVLPGEAPTTGCRVCDADNRMIALENSGKATPRQARAIEKLHEWHSACDLLAYNPYLPINEGPVCFARCCFIYRAAGWPG